MAIGYEISVIWSASLATRRSLRKTVRSEPT